MPSPRSAALARVRRACLALPDASERLSHGTPTFFVAESRSFVMFWDDHHGDGRLALWCAAPPGMQDALVGANAEAYFVPPYVGHRGWIGVRLDRGLPWDDVAAVVREAYAFRAPKRLAALRSTTATRSSPRRSRSGENP